MTISLISTLIHIPLVIAAIVIFFKIRVIGDARLITARNAALSMLAFQLAFILLQIGTDSYIDYISLLISVTILVLKLWVMIYVGQFLWEQLNGDYWGIDRFRANPRTFVYYGLTAAVVMVAYSILLFALTKPSAGPVIEMFYGEDDPALDFQDIVYLLVFLTYFAIAEEFIYRGCFQSMLSRWFGSSGAGITASTLITALLWTIAHSGSLEPDWIKYVQVFPMGLFLSYWFVRFGFLGTASVHLAFNLLMTPFGENLINFD